MTRDVITVSEDASLHDIAVLLEKHRIKRVPVTRDGKLTGIVSRAKLLQGFVADSASSGATGGTGTTIRSAIKSSTAYGKRMSRL